MEKKIVILFEVHPVVTYSSRYDYQAYIQAGYQLDICDLSGVISDLYSNKDDKPKDSEGIRYYAFQSKKQFKQYVNNLDNNAFIWSTFQLTAEYWWIFKLISRHRYGFICNIDYVIPRSKSRIKQKNYWTNLSWHRVSNALLYRTPRKYIPIRKADAVITYGEEDIQRKLNNVLYDEHTIIELTNTIDYNACVKALSQNTDDDLNLPDDYIVFIDEYMPYHPDGLKLGMHIDEIMYYQEVETFLRRVSAIMGIPVMVAAHPKADYKLHSECYQGMRIIQFKTAELIKKAKFVITHLSIATSMILISRKPYLLITTDEVDRVIHANGINEDWEKDLEKKEINISNELSDDDLQYQIKQAQETGQDYYDRQIHKYKLPEGHPNESLTFGEIVMKTMRKVEAIESKEV